MTGGRCSAVQYLRGSVNDPLAFTACECSTPLLQSGLTVVDPIVGVTVGLAALGEAAGTPAWSFVVFVVAGVVAVIGVLLLSRASARET